MIMKACEINTKVKPNLTKLRILKKYNQKCPMKMKYKKTDIIKTFGDPTRLKILPFGTW